MTGRRISIAVAIVAASACTGAGQMTTARTLASGQHQWIVSPELNPTPEIGVGYRRGVGAEVEVGAKVTGLPAGEALTTFGAEIGAKRRLMAGERFELAVGLGAGYRLIHSSGANWESGYVELPLVAGVNLRRGRDQLVFGPKVGYQRWYSSGSMPVDVPFGGVALGYAWAANDRLTVFPELSLLRSPTPVQDEGRYVMFHFGVGFMWGDR